jgi:hypothetical protein
MLLTRILPIIIIGVGFLICRSIFRAWPLGKQTLMEQANKIQVLSAWLLAFVIIFAQISYIFKIFSNLFKVSDTFVIPFFIGIFVVIFVIAFVIYKNYEG